MSIKEKGYTHWDGELKPGRFPWKPIFRYGIKMTFKKKFFKPLFAGTIFPVLGFLVVIYISERIQDFRFMLDKSQLPFSVDPNFFKLYLCNDAILFMMLMLMIFAGAGLLSEDLKYNSLQLYFARPLKKIHFFMGKFSIVAFFLLVVTLVPGLILFIMKLVFSGSIKFLTTYPLLPFAIIGFSLFITLFFSCYTLFLSSMSKNRRYVSIMMFGLYLISDILFGIFFGIFRKPGFQLISIKENLMQVGSMFFGQKLRFDMSPWYSFLILTGFCLISFYFLHRKVRGVEIVK